MTDNFSDLNQDLSNINPDKIGSEGQYFPLGNFHVEVLSMERAGGGKGAFILTFHCLASSSPDAQKGDTHEEWFYTSPAAYGRILQLAVACRLTTAKQLKEWKDANQPAAIDWGSIKGRQCMVATEEDEYEGKIRHKINYNIYDVSNPKTDKWPKNDVFLNRHNTTYPLKDADFTPSGQHPQTEQPPATKPAEPQQTQSAGSFFDN